MEEGAVPGAGGCALFEAACVLHGSCVLEAVFARRQRRRVYPSQNLAGGSGLAREAVLQLAMPCSLLDF